MRLQKRGHRLLHNIISLVMAKTQRTNGNWGEQQRNILHGLLSTNQVNHRNRQPDYVWKVCNLKPFKEFISEGKNGKASAIKRMKDCFLKYEEGTLLTGARKKGMYFFLLITLFRLILTDSFCYNLTQQPVWLVLGRT